jgi:quercetin dioxygenase-like cupin family protein
MRTSLVASWLVVTFAGGLVVGNAAGQARPRMWTDTVLDVVTKELPRSVRVRANVNHWDPGSETGRHTHPGPTVFVMLEGELEEILPDGTTRALRAGQAVWKPPRTHHNVRNASARPARALAVHLDPSGE